MTEIPVKPSVDNMQEGKQLAVQRIYIKDCSFESPRAPAVFSSPIEPDVKVNMRSDFNDLGDDTYEVVLTITLDAQSENRSIFLVEVHQAGIFIIRGFSDQERQALLGSYCPNLLFAYARQAVSDLVQKGGMPIILLQPVNFDAIYLHSIANAKNPPGDTSIPA